MTVNLGKHFPLMVLSVR